MKLTGTIVALLTLAVAAPAARASSVIGSGGKLGASLVGQGTCKYGVFGPNGVLTVGVPSPAVSGADTRRRTRRERTWVRFRVSVTDAFQGSAPIQTSGWSAWRHVRQSGSAGWPAPTFFDLDWRGNYGADLEVEWWSSKRMVGWRTHRLTTFGFYDQYDAGPFGPIASCYKPTDIGV